MEIPSYIPEDELNKIDTSFEEEKNEEEEKINEEWSAKDFKGMFHFHSSAGSPCARDSVKNIKEFIAQKTGMEYIGITEHTSQPSADYQWPEKLLNEFEEIDLINQEPGPYIFKGIELDALSDGTVNTTQEVLNNADFVIASIHYKALGEPDLITAESTVNRLIKVINKYPEINVLGHLLRELPTEEWEKFDWDSLFKVAKESNVITEINMHKTSYVDMPDAFYEALIRYNMLVAFTPDFHEVRDYLDLVNDLSEDDLAYLENFRKLMSARNKLGFSGTELKNVPNSLALDDATNIDNLEILKMYEKYLKKMENSETLFKIYGILLRNDKETVVINGQNGQPNEKIINRKGIPFPVLMKYSRIIHSAKAFLKDLPKENIVNLWNKEEMEEWIDKRKLNIVQEEKNEN